MGYQDIDDIVVDIDPDLSAAEIHGIACGMICVNQQTSTKSWLQEAFQDVDFPNNTGKGVLEKLFGSTAAQLINQDFEFELLLPEDDTPLPERLEALAKWCQGYLFGIGTGSLDSTWPADMLEVIRDITELTKLDTNAEGEAAENDFMEIAEYVKTGVVFINAELNALPGTTIH